jgi:outer membrane biogenesis lipoprotein LolB
VQKRDTIARRHLILAGTAGLLLLPACAHAEESAQKLSKTDAEYQDSPKNDQQCSDCTKFQPLASCSVVAGDISPRGWCKLFEAPPE